MAGPDIDLADLGAAIGDVLGGTGWTLSPLGGSTGRTFAATGPRAVVVRLDAAAPVLRRVSEIGVAPRVLGAGRWRGRELVIQEHVRGSRAARGWLADHPLEVARVVAAYAADVELRDLAEPLAADTYAEDLLAGARRAGLTRARLARVEALVDGAGELEPLEPVASHGDPNSENFLLAERLLLVDWDDLRRADPVRDLGQLAWWYLAEADWPRLVETAGQRWQRSTVDRLYWWVAAESLDVALRLLPEDPAAAEAFLVDFDAAIEHRPNPRGGAAPVSPPEGGPRSSGTRARAPRSEPTD